MNKEFLAGGKEKAKVMLNEEVKSAKSIKSKRSLLDNVPPGVTISRLDYPVYVKGKVTMSTVILLGVKQRAIIHASFVNGKSSSHCFYFCLQTSWKHSNPRLSSCNCLQICHCLSELTAIKTIKQNGLVSLTVVRMSDFMSALDLSTQAIWFWTISKEWKHYLKTISCRQLMSLKLDRSVSIPSSRVSYSPTSNQTLCWRLFSTAIIMFSTKTYRRWLGICL